MDELTNEEVGERCGVEVDRQTDRQRDLLVVEVLEGREENTDGVLGVFGHMEGMIDGCRGTLKENWGEPSQRGGSFIDVLKGARKGGRIFLSVKNFTLKIRFAFPSLVTL
ncbi:hypothetical protein Pcinc_024069 [Petrolisthes cinctipes]|uniref:Uncharacterized protein n=1 Tax=Petrolisthes cinctipes TaxID=88211 RepID=A0AAE1FBA7_PETCI|nr:hypothetical protein Pcinc_024069 [Petrolisthes cinctipes]